MKTNLIEGINPLVISSIEAKAGTRYGSHPYWVKVMTKRNPIRGYLGVYHHLSFEGWYPPEVIIYGPNKTRLAIINCRSNERAMKYRDELQSYLDEFLSKILVDI
jgi:hypothetical protein